MNKSRLFAALVFSVCVALLGACTGETPLVVTPEIPIVQGTSTALLPAAETPATAPTPSLAVVASATVAVAPTVASPTHKVDTAEVPFALGVRAGDAYGARSVAIDEEDSRAYVYCTSSGGGGPVISVVDLGHRVVERLIPLGPTTTASTGKAVLSSDGLTLYVVVGDTDSLVTVDARSGALGAGIQDVRDVVLSDTGKKIFVVGQDSVSAYDATGLRSGGQDAEWTVAIDGIDRVALGEDGLLVTVQGAEPHAILLDAGTGRTIAEATLPGYPAQVTAGPAGGWAIRISAETPQLYRLNRLLEPAGTVDIPYGDDLYYDEGRQRYIVSGWRSDASGRTSILAFAAADLSLTAAYDWNGADLPDLFSAAGSDRLMGFAKYGASHVTFLDPDTLAPGDSIVLGVRLTAMILDDSATAAGGEAATLYVADDQGAIHVLDLPAGAEQTRWDGGAPLALDAANRRIYVNRDGQVVALSTADGRLIASFGQKGVAAADPDRDLVYIAEAGVSIYDRRGRLLGRLEDTFPIEHGFVPNPSGFGVQVNPFNGNAVVWMDNGIPGSNGGSYLSIYRLAGMAGGNPLFEHPIQPPGSYSSVQDAIFVPDTGRSYVSYSTSKNQEMIQLLDASASELVRLGGRTDHLVFDAEADRLYAIQDGVLAVVASDSLTPVEFRKFSGRADAAVFSGGSRQLILLDRTSSELSVVSIDSLEPLDSRPQAVSGFPEGAVTSVDVVRRADQIAFFLVAGGKPYRGTSDRPDLEPERWERLPVGSLDVWGQLTVAPDGVLFYTGQGSYGADGIWRSLDAGDTWQLLDDGLTDLRAAQAVRARSADEAYYVGRTGGILAWDSAARRWQSVVSGEGDYGSAGNLSLAPDGTLFLARWSVIERSEDGGATWKSLQLPAAYGSLLGFSPEYGENATLFGLFGESEQVPMVSRDGGESWQPMLASEHLSSQGASFQLLSAPNTSYLFGRRYGDDRRLFYRSTDQGRNWQASDPSALEGSEVVTLGPDGWLWASSEGRLVALDPDSMRWSPIGASAPRQTVSPAAVPTPCAVSLSASDAALAARNPELGCPLADPSSMQGARQEFQHGRMFWLGESGEIVVLAEDGGWQQWADHWLETDAPYDPAIVTPAGLQQPVRGFGKIWREQLGAANAAIGWALEAERSVEIHRRSWSGGIVLAVDSEVFVLLSGGSWRHDPS